MAIRQLITYYNAIPMAVLINYHYRSIQIILLQIDSALKWFSNYFGQTYSKLDIYIQVKLIAEYSLYSILRY